MVRHPSSFSVAVVIRVRVLTSGIHVLTHSLLNDASYLAAGFSRLPVDLHVSERTASEEVKFFFGYAAAEVADASHVPIKNGRIVECAVVFHDV